MLHQIGIGTLGPVFRTYEPSRDRLVAVKVFRLDIVPEQAQALATALSRAAHASLFHPSIVEPIDAGLEGTVAYRAEEYVAAESLDVAMRHYAPAPIEKVLPFITQLAGAIDFARAAGIGHGGLHPRDIFVTPDDARATGFGVVEALEQVGIRAPIRRPYSAPERIDGRAWSTQADVFSLAAIAFELLTGKRAAGTGAELGPLPDTAHAAALHSVLARAMHDEPAGRYASALAFAGALEAASQGRPLTDAVTQVTAIAEVGSREPAAERPEPLAVDLDVPPAEPVLQAHTDVHEPAPIVLDLPHAAQPFDAREAEGKSEGRRPAEDIDDMPLAPPVASRITALFDTANDDERTRDRFVDDFVEEQEAEPDLRSPLEAAPPFAADEPPVYEPPAARPVEAPMFRAVAQEPDLHDSDHGRPAILPYAVVSVLMLLVGFAGGYFVGSRDRLTPAHETEQASASPATPSAPVGAATRETPGQYSEQKVTAPPPAAPPETRPGPAARTPSATPETPRPTSEARAPAAIAATKGQIVVKSLPARAGVTVNGTWRGRTPLTLRNLAFGTYTVRVVQPGYNVARDEVTLHAAAPSHTFTARLERAAPAPARAAPAAQPEVFSGSLYVDSRPRGAKVLLDGRNVGQTPLSIPDVRAGTHVVRIEMDGKKPVTAAPRIVAGKMERVTVSLEDK